MLDCDPGHFAESLPYLDQSLNLSTCSDLQVHNQILVCLSRFRFCFQYQIHTCVKFARHCPFTRSAPAWGVAMNPGAGDSYAPSLPLPAWLWLALKCCGVAIAFRFIIRTHADSNSICPNSDPHLDSDSY